MGTLTKLDSTARRDRRRMVLPCAVAGLAIVVLMGGCSEDGPLSGVTLPGVSAPDGGGQPAETNPPEPEPEPEATAEPAPEPTPDPGPEPEVPADSDDDSDDGVSAQDILLIALLGVALLIVVAIVKKLASPRARHAAPVPAPIQPSRLSDLVGGCRWVHDIGSMELLRTSDPAQLGRAWQVTGARIVELEAWAASLAIEATTTESAMALREIGRTTAGLRTALESDVTLRTDPAMADRDDLVRASTQTVQQRRMDLDVALANPALRTR